MEEGVPPDAAAALEPHPALAPPAPTERLEALFAAVLAEGWLKEAQCNGMKKGMVGSVLAGKKTEDEALAEAAAKLEGMKKGGNKKHKQKQPKKEPAPAAAPGGGGAAPRVEALFDQVTEEGWLKAHICDGMMRGFVEKVRSGKMTEDDALGQAAAKLEGMRKGGAAKLDKKVKRTPSSDMEAQQQGKQQKLKKRAPKQILAQLAKSAKAEAQLGAANHIVEVCFHLRGQVKREFQDALTPALNLLTAMANSEAEERVSTALHALYVLTAHHKVHVVMLAATDIVATITQVLQAVSSSLGVKTNACLVLNTLATNAFSSHAQIVSCGLLPWLIESLAAPKPPARPAAECEAAVGRLVNCLPEEVKQPLGALNEATEKILTVVRGLPGSGKTHIARGVATFLKSGSPLICSADSYFMTEDERGQPVYDFDPKRMKDAHKHCQMQFQEALTLESRVIVVDNTNLKRKEYAGYVTQGKDAGYKVVIVDVECRHDADAELFYSRCVHNVPLEQVKQMKQNYQLDPAAIAVTPWGAIDVSEQEQDFDGAPPSPLSFKDEASPSLRPALTRESSVDSEELGKFLPREMSTPRRGQKVKPLRFSTLKILNSLTYNPAMRETLIKAGCVVALNARLMELTGQDEETSADRSHMAMACSDEYLWTLRASVKLVGQEEESLISDELQTRGIRWILGALSASLAGKGFPFENSTPATPAKYAQDIACLAISDANAKMLTELNAYDLIKRTFLGEWSEQTAINMNSDPLLHAQALNHGVATLSTLSFGEETRQLINESEELMQMLKQLAEDSTGIITPRVGAAAQDAFHEEAKGSLEFAEAMRAARKQAKVLLLNLKRHGEVLEPVVEDGRESDDEGDAKGKHIMLSYCWGDIDESTGKYPNQQLVLRICGALQQRGHNVWMDVFDLSGSTLNAMADAVENSEVVIIVMTRKYKESSACRMEADYAYQLQSRQGTPKIVMLKAEDFRPDGWLGMLLGSKLWYNIYDPSKFEVELEHMVSKNLSDCTVLVAPKAGAGGQRSRSESRSEGRPPSLSGASTSTAPAPGQSVAASPLDSSGRSGGSGCESPSFNGFPSLSPLPTTSHSSTVPTMTQMAHAAAPTEQLLSTISASIESAERGRAAAERALVASEERVKTLEQRLAGEQESRLAVLAEQMEALKLRNVALEASSFIGSDREGGVEAAELEQWLSGINLSRYTTALIKEGYDALEFVRMATEDEVAALCKAAGMKAPHAQKFAREAAAVRGE